MSKPQFTTPTRVCSKCQQEKTLDRYEPRKNRPFGMQTMCRDCRRAARFADPEQLARTRERDNTRARGKAHPSGPTEPWRRRARVALRRAVQAGRIVRPTTCQECGGGGRIEAHHEDYSRPLAVAWLCRACHSRRHRKYDAA